MAVHWVLDVHPTGVATREGSSLEPKKNNVWFIPISKSLPVNVTSVPPAAGPRFGLISVSSRSGSYVHSHSSLLRSGGVLTVRPTNSNVFGPLGGATAVHCVVLEQWTWVARYEPKSTTVAPGVVSKRTPVIVTNVPTGPCPGLGAWVMSGGAR